MLNRRWYIYCDVNSKSLLNSGSFLTYKSPVSHSIFAIKRKWVLSAALSLPGTCSGIIERRGCPSAKATNLADCRLSVVIVLQEEHPRNRSPQKEKQS